MDFPMHENEMLVWFLGTLVLAFLIFYRQQLHRLPNSLLLLIAYLAVWISWTATNLEHLFFYQFFNVVEHIGYALNGVLMLSWCCFAFVLQSRGQHQHDYHD